MDVPDEPGGHETGLRARLKRLVWDDRPWEIPPFPVAESQEGLDMRYRRVLARVRESRGGADSPMRVLVLVVGDDPTAHRAVARLAFAAGSERAHAQVVLRLTDVSPRRPTVPDDSEVAGVVVVLTAGTRTSWELLGIAEACTDAGHQVIGTVVTHRTAPIEPRMVAPAEVVA